MTVQCPRARGLDGLLLRYSLGSTEPGRWAVAITLRDRADPRSCVRGLRRQNPPGRHRRPRSPSAADRRLAACGEHYGARKAVQAACIRSTCPGVNMNMQESCV